MAKTTKKSVRISERDILAMYEEVLPLLSYNPDGLNVSDQVNKRTLAFVHYDFGHYFMDDPTPDHVQRRMEMNYEQWERFSSGNDASILLYSSSKDLTEDVFDKLVENNYQNAITRSKAEYPEFCDFHYRRIESKTQPRIVLGFFRRTNAHLNNAFTPKENKIFDELAPHLILLCRTVLHQVYQSQAFQYFDSFAAIGSRLASEHKLSDTEVRLLPDILFGYTNEEIAERHFISLATVKSHIRHILKKTGTKNRIDFISKFFKSPERVQF